VGGVRLRPLAKGAEEEPSGGSRQGRKGAGSRGEEHVAARALGGEEGGAVGPTRAYQGRKSVSIGEYPHGGQRDKPHNRSGHEENRLEEGLGVGFSLVSWLRARKARPEG
jgi:hypothetical protein